MTFRSIFLFSRRHVSPVSNIGEEEGGERVYCPPSSHTTIWLMVNVSFYKGMTEFQEGEVSVICRKIILIHGQSPGFCYLQVKRFKWGFSQVLMNTTIFEFEFPSNGICFWFWTWFSCRPMTMKQGLSQPITASLHHCGRGGAVNYTQINQHNKRREIWIRTFTSSSGLQEILIWSGCLRNSKTQDLGHESE